MKTGWLNLRFRTLFWGGVALILAALLVVAFRPRPALVDIGEVSRGGFTVAVRDEARTRVRDVYVVSAPVAGRLLRVGDRVGEHVDAGAVVAVIQPGPSPLTDERSRRELEAGVRTAEAGVALARAEVDRAEAQLGNASQEAERAETLFQSRIVSQSALDRARLEVRTARAASNTARAGLRARQAELDAARTRLREPNLAVGSARAVSVQAPASGRILRVLQESERVVPQGAALLELGNPGDMDVVAELLSNDAARIRVGTSVTIDAWGGPSLQGRVRRIEPYGFLKISALGVEEQRVNVIVEPINPPVEWRAVGHGYRVEVAVTLREVRSAIRLPVAALFRSQGRWAVFVVDGDRARLRRVEIGDNNGEFAEVRSGLRPGDRVVLHPGESVADGSRIRPRPVA